MPNLSIGDKAKQAVGRLAAEMIESGMVVGLGTGTTAAYFIQHLIERCKKGLRIHAIATSLKSQMAAQLGGIPLLDVNSLTQIDVVVDGADEIDPKKRMIKGGGGALLREKIVAMMAKEMIVIVDESKCVKSLGSFPLPVEIVPFAFHSTIDKIKKSGFNPELRLTPRHTPYITDNGNYIVDLQFSTDLDQPEKINQVLHSIPGVIETGLFINMAGPVLIGYYDGTTEIKM